MNENIKKVLVAAKEITIQISYSALNTAVCGYVARKVDWYITDQEQKKIAAEEKAPPPLRHRIGFHNHGSEKE